MFLLFAIPSGAAEFDEDNVLPEVTSLVFTQNEIAMTVQAPRSWLGHEDKYFVASRNSYNFRQVSKRALSELLRTNFYHRQFDGYAYLNTFETRYQLGQRETLVEKPESKCSPDAPSTRFVVRSLNCNLLY